MLTSGDVLPVDLAVPHGHEAGFPRPAVVVTAQRILDHDPTVVQFVPLTTRVRGYESEVTVEPSAHNGLERPSAAQCPHLRSVARPRLGAPVGNIGAAHLAAVRGTIAAILDLPA